MSNLPGYDWRKNERKNMNNSQLELGLGNGRGCQSVNGRQRRLSRATWWFERMRQVVERAMDWEPAPEPRPEQIRFAEAQRTVLAGSPNQGPDEREMCE